MYVRTTSELRAVHSIRKDGQTVLNLLHRQCFLAPGCIMLPVGQSSPLRPLTMLSYIII